MTNQDQIRHLKACIADLSERLSYADGQAYYDDKRKIEAFSAELRALESASTAQQGEAVEVVAWQDAENPLYTTSERRVMQEWANNQYPIVELMTVAQHNALIAKRDARIEGMEIACERLRDMLAGEVQCNVNLRLELAALYAQPVPEGWRLVPVEPTPELDAATGGQPSAIALAIEAAEEEHGSLRAAAKALGIDPGYLSRLASGEKVNPSDKVLSALGLERVTIYRSAAPVQPAAQRANAALIAACDPDTIRELLAEMQRLREALECVKQAGFDCGNDGWGVIHMTNDDWQIVLAASTGQQQASRCSECGYLTSHREHLGCLRKAVAELDAATRTWPD